MMATETAASKQAPDAAGTKSKDGLPSISDAATVAACWAECRQLQAMSPFPEDVAFCISVPVRFAC